MAVALHREDFGGERGWLDRAADEVSSALATEGATNVRKALEANAAVVAAIQARGVTMTEVLGATSDGTVVTVYAVAETSGG